MENNKDTILPVNPSGQINFGLSLLFIVFVIFGLWSYFAPLATYAVAVGSVSADVNKKSVQHLDGGIIDKIYIKEGDSVKKGQLLIKLNDVNIKSQLDILVDQYLNYLGNYTRLSAQSENATKLVFPKELQDQSIINNQKKIFYTQLSALQEEENIINKRIIQFGDEIIGLKDLNKNKHKRLLSLKEEVVEREELVKKKYTDKTKVRDLKREIHSLEGEIANTKAEIAKLNEQINELRNQQILKKQEFQKEVLSQLIEIKPKMFDTKSKIFATQDNLERTEITAPISGNIVGFTKHTIGGVIINGEKILDIVPKATKLIVVAKVNITDIDKVTEGLHAEIRFSAFNLKKTKVILGKVVYVSHDAFEDKEKNMTYYEAKIEVTAEGIKRLEDYNFVLVSGMPAEVMIQTGDRTMLSYIIKPFLDMFSRSFNEE